MEYMVREGEMPLTDKLQVQTDAEEEMEDGLALGINHLDGTPKYVYKVFKYMDTPEEKKYTDFAKEIIGISEWF